MKEDNIKIDTVELDENEKIPNLDPYDAMIVMGGPMDTWQEETFPWLKPEKEAIHKFVVINKKPYLGLCLGAQLLSEAVGGKVRKMKTPEIGVLKVSVINNNSLSKPLKRDLLFFKETFKTPISGVCIFLTLPPTASLRSWAPRHKPKYGFLFTETNL